MPKNTAETTTKTPVHTRMCIKKRKIGNAALASTIKKRALRAESRQCAVGGKPPAMVNRRLIYSTVLEVYRLGQLMQRRNRI